MHGMNSKIAHSSWFQTTVEYPLYCHCVRVIRAKLFVLEVGHEDEYRSKIKTYYNASDSYQKKTCPRNAKKLNITVTLAKAYNSIRKQILPRVNMTVSSKTGDFLDPSIARLVQGLLLLSVICHKRHTWSIRLSEAAATLKDMIRILSRPLTTLHIPNSAPINQRCLRKAKLQIRPALVYIARV